MARDIKIRPIWKVILITDDPDKKVLLEKKHNTVVIENEAKWQRTTVF